MWAGMQSSISRSEVTESVKYGNEAGGVKEMTDGQGWRWWIRRGWGLWSEEGAWEDRLCEEIERKS